MTSLFSSEKNTTHLAGKENDDSSDALLANFLEKTQLREEDIKIETELSRRSILIILSGPVNERLGNEEFIFDETHHREDVISAWIVEVSGNTLYLDRAATLPIFRQCGASTLLLDNILSQYPGITNIVAPYVAGINMDIYQREGIHNIPLSKTLKRLGFEIEPQLYFNDNGEAPELRAMKKVH